MGGTGDSAAATLAPHVHLYLRDLSTVAGWEAKRLAALRQVPEARWPYLPAARRGIESASGRPAAWYLGSSFL